MESAVFHHSKVWNLAIHISLSTIINNLALFSMNTSTENIAITLNWDKSYTARSFYPSLYPVGMFIGTLIAVPLANRFGIRKVIIAGDFIFILGSFLSMIPTNLTLGLGRSIGGIVGGIFIVLPPVFINEVTPDQLTGPVGSLIQQGTGVAIIVSFSLGLFLPTENLKEDPSNICWVFLFGFPVLACIYQLAFFLLVYKHENPGWYVKQGRLQEASEALKYVYTEESVKIGLKRLTLHDDNSLLAKTPNFKQLTCSKTYRKMMRISLFLNIGQQITGSLAIIMYSTSMFNEMGGSIFFSKVLTVIQGFVIFFSGLLAVFFIKFFGRKTILVCGCFGCAVILFTLGITTKFYPVKPLVNCVLVFSYLFIFVVAMGATFWTYLAEICVDQVFGIGISVNIFSAFVISFLFPLGIHYIGVSAFFFFFSVSSFLLGIYLALDAVETKGLRKQEIYDLITNS